MIHVSLSDMVTVVGILVTIASVVWAMYEKRQTLSAREEAGRFRQLIIKQQIAEQFAQAPQLALDLTRAIRAKEWENGSECALKLCAELASLRGVHSELIGHQHQQELDTALAVLGELNRRIPRGHVAVEENVSAQLSDACNIIVISVHAIKRTLLIRAALGGDHDAK